MAKKKKRELTSAEKYVKCRNSGYVCLGMKWLSILSPYIVIGAINFDEYFQETSGVKMSLGCILALIVAGISVANETKENKKVSGLVGWAIAFALIYFFQSILQDLLLIVGCGFVGQLVGAAFELGAESKLEKAELYKKANINAEAMHREVT